MSGSGFTPLRLPISSLGTSASLRLSFSNYSSKGEGEVKKEAANAPLKHPLILGSGFVLLDTTLS